MLRLTTGLLLVFAACTPADDPLPEQAEPEPDEPLEVRSGIDVLLGDPPGVLQGRRIGLITNHTGIGRDGTSSIDLLNGREDMELVALFSPEHGIRGTAAPGELVDSEVDEETGLPIHSLYGETRRPTPEMLEGVEALLFDIQDVGARQYTYVYTMALGMEAAAEAGIPFAVLDRPNPIGGAAGGNILDPDFASFVGMYPIASRHGMTAGELAELFNVEFGIGAELTVVPVEGWEREMWFDETELPWLAPSPNLPTLQSAIHYPGTVFFEGTNLSEGRGTDHPFEQTGAPWLRADEVADSMNARELPGVRFEAVESAVDPEAVKFPGRELPGVRLVFDDRDSYEPIPAALLLIDTIRRLHPDDFEWSGTLDRLAGTDRLRLAMEDGTLEALLDEWDEDAAEFRETREGYLMY